MSVWGGIGEALMGLGGQMFADARQERAYNARSAEEEKKWKLREQIRANNEMELARMKALYESEAEAAKKDSAEYKEEQQRKREKHASDMANAEATRKLRAAQAAKALRPPQPRASDKRDEEKLENLPPYLQEALGMGRKAMEQGFNWWVNRGR